MINNNIFFKLLKKTLKLSTYKVLTRFFIYIYNSKLKSGTFIYKKITTGWANLNEFHKKVIIMYKMKLNLFAYSKKKIKINPTSTPDTLSGGRHLEIHGNINALCKSIQLIKRRDARNLFV